MTNLPSLRTFLRHHKALDKSPFCVNPVVANYCLFSIVACKLEVFRRLFMQSFAFPLSFGWKGNCFKNLAKPSTFNFFDQFS